MVILGRGLLRFGLTFLFSPNYLRENKPTPWTPRIIAVGAQVPSDSKSDVPSNSDRRMCLSLDALHRLQYHWFTFPTDRLVDSAVVSWVWDTTFVGRVLCLSAGKHDRATATDCVAGS